MSRNVRRAETLARRALSLDPRLVDAHLLSFVIASVRGDSTEAIAAARRAWEVDTLSYYGVFFYAEALGQNRRFDQLAAFVRHARDLMPADEARGWEGVARLGAGDCPRAVELLRDARESHFRMDLGLSLACAGRGKEARAVLDSTLSESHRRYVNGYFIAALQVALGDRDAAFEWLDRAAQEGTAYLAYLATDFRWDAIRSDARFADLQRRLWTQETTR